MSGLVVLYPTFTHISQPLPTFAKIFYRGRVEVAYKSANKIEHFGLDKALIYKDDEIRLQPVV